MLLTVFINGERGISVVRSLLKKKRVIKFIVCLKSLEKNILRKIKELGLSIIYFDKTSERLFLNKILRSKIDLIIVAGFPKILSKTIIDSPKFGVLNLHAGPVPGFRGGSPLNWQIINGKEKIGISFLKMNENIDEGNLYNTFYFKLNKNETIADAHLKANKLFSEKINSIVDKISKGFLGKVQDSNKAIYMHQRSDTDSQINWNCNSFEIFNFVRALVKPYKGAYTFFKNKKIRIYKVEESSYTLRGDPGRFFVLLNIGLVVICGKGSLIIKSYKLEGKGEKLKSGIFYRKYE